MQCNVSTDRLKDYDYSSDGSYFITICIDDRKCHFGFIRNYQMYLSKLGEIAIKFWKEIPAHFPFVILDLFVIMPNHIHGILIIDKEYKIEGHLGNKNLNQIDENRRDAINRVSTISVENKKEGGITGKYNPMLNSELLSKIIRWVKGRTSFEINQQFPNKNFQWQPRFHDHIIRTPVKIAER